MSIIKLIEYIVRGSAAGFCVIESMTASNGKTYQRSITYGLTQEAAQDCANSFQATFENRNIRPSAKAE